MKVLTLDEKYFNYLADMTGKVTTPLTPFEDRDPTGCIETSE